MKKTKAIPREIPHILILPMANPNAQISETITTVCTAEGVKNKLFIHSIYILI